VGRGPDAHSSHYRRGAAPRQIRPPQGAGSLGSHYQPRRHHPGAPLDAARPAAARPRRGVGHGLSGAGFSRAVQFCVDGAGRSSTGPLRPRHPRSRRSSSGARSRTSRCGSLRPRGLGIASKGGARRGSWRARGLPSPEGRRRNASAVQGLRIFTRTRDAHAPVGGAAGADAARRGHAHGMHPVGAARPSRGPAAIPPPPPPSFRTKWTRRVPHPVPIGHAASLTPCQSDTPRPSPCLTRRTGLPGGGGPPRAQSGGELPRVRAHATSRHAQPAARLLRAASARTTRAAPLSAPPRQVPSAAGGARAVEGRGLHARGRRGAAGAAPCGFPAPARCRFFALRFVTVCH
jgi:hypothetical protein